MGVGVWVRGHRHRRHVLAREDSAGLRVVFARGVADPTVKGGEADFVRCPEELGVILTATAVRVRWRASVWNLHHALDPGGLLEDCLLRVGVLCGFWVGVRVRRRAPVSDLRVHKFTHHPFRRCEHLAVTREL